MVRQTTSDHLRMRSAIGLELRAWPAPVKWVMWVVLAVTGAVIIFYGVISASPLPDHRLIVGWNDVLLHVGAFFALTLVGALMFAPARRVGVMAFAAGFLMEIIQIASPHHQPSLRDLVADGMGVVLALVVFGAVSWAWMRLVGMALPGPVRTGEPI
jgi:VanZ family protein